MEVSGILFEFGWLVAIGVVYLLALIWALRSAYWKRLVDAQQLNAFLGACVALMLVWSLRAEVAEGFNWHLLGMVSVTLMFGWSLAVIGGSLSLLAVCLAGLSDWSGFLPSAVLQIIVPASLTQLMLMLARRYLPKHFFIYVFINAFLTGGLSAIAVAYATVGLVWLTGSYNLQSLEQTYLLFLPLMFFPEAFVNGLMMSVLVAYRPEWVGSFRDEEYIDGK